MKGSHGDRFAGGGPAGRAVFRPGKLGERHILCRQYIRPTLSAPSHLGRGRNPLRRSCLFADGIPHREGLGAGRDAVMSKAVQFSAFEPPEDLHVQFWFRETRY